MKDYSTVTVKNSESNDAMTELPIPDDTVNVHLRPGGIVHINEDVSDVKTTFDLLGKKYTIVVNRDTNGKASGKMFLDDSDTISSLQYGQYEKYELSMQENSLIRYKLNDNENSTDLGYTIDKIVIANAEDMKDADFACYMSQYPGEGIQQLAAPIYNETTKTLTLKAAGDDNLRLFYIPWFNFGKSDRDLSLCADNSASYYW